MILTPTVTEVARLVRATMREPLTVGEDEATGAMVFTFDPPLTAAEQTLFDNLVRQVRSRVPGITPAEWEALKPNLAALRTFRQQTQAEFMAKTATVRDRELFDAINAITNVLRALLRD